MTLRLRLVLGLAAVALLLGAPLALAIRALRHAEQTTVALRDNEVAGSLLVGRVREALRDAQRAENAVLFVSDDPASAEWMQASAASLRSLADSVGHYQLDALRGQLAHTADALETFGPAEQAAVAAHNTSLADQISSQRVGPALAAAERAVGNASRTIGARAQTRAGETADAAADARHRTVLLLIAAAAGALAVAVWLTRSVSGPVRALERGLAAVAGGDFQHRLGIPASRHDEFGRLAGSFEQMANRLAELDKLKAEFVSVASHELKTPINVIVGYVSLLSDGLYGPVPEPQRAVLGTIDRQARTLTRLVQHLLDLSRFQAGTARLDPRPVPLRALLADAEQAHAVLARQRGLAFRSELAPGLPESVTWDADRVHEVLDNLLTNAVKFTPAGGSVTLAAAPVSDGAGAPAVRLEVRDTGVGIPGEQLAHIFEKFYQASNQAGAAAKGTGLGLAITKEIIDAHGGTIAVDSAPGVGTRFTVTLPAVAPSAPGPEGNHDLDGSTAPAAEGAEVASPSPVLASATG